VVDDRLELLDLDHEVRDGALTPSAAAEIERASARLGVGQPAVGPEVVAQVALELILGRGGATPARSSAPAAVDRRRGDQSRRQSVSVRAVASLERGGVVARDRRRITQHGAQARADLVARARGQRPHADRRRRERVVERRRRRLQLRAVVRVAELERGRERGERTQPVRVAVVWILQRDPVAVPRRR
jgi:hypothetical protein